MSATSLDSRIHFPTHEFHPYIGGIGVYIEELAKACAEAGASPVVWAPDYGGFQDDPAPYRVNRVRMRGKQDWICRIRMGRALRRGIANSEKDCIVLAEPGPLRWWMYRTLTRPPCVGRLVVVLHGSELQLLSSNPWERFLLGKLLSRADSVGVVSKAIRQRAVTTYPHIAPKVVLVPGALRSRLVDQTLPKWERRKPEVLQVGRLHPRKGQLELVHAFARLPEKIRCQYRLRLVGPHAKPSYVDRVRRAAAENAVSIDLPGAVDAPQLVQAYSDAQVVVMPSRDYKSSVEGLGMALLEAQYMGCPVIATDVGGVSEALLPDLSGYLVAPGDPEQLSDAIVRLLEDPGQAAHMGIRGRQFVKESFSWNKNTQVLELT